MSHSRKLIAPKLYRTLVAAALITNGIFQLVAPALAEGTAAGQPISNTATATFSDGTTTYNATSNEIVITVAEVAGINITSQTPSVPAPNAGDTLYVDYVITNTGNDPTQFFIPGNATLNNTTAFSQNGPLQIVARDGTALGTPVNVPAAGGNTGDAALLGPTNGSIAPNPGTGTTGTITVRVPIKVLATATAGQTLKVSLGDTATPDLQNQPETATPGTKDVYTVDNTTSGVGGETNATAPTNGTREAMATSSTITVNARQQAFATVLKAVSSYSGGADANSLLDDVLTYKLALRVENPTTPPAGLVASDLHGTGINVDNSTATPYVLVSDAIPDKMQLSSTNPAGPSAAWKPVYTTDALTTSALQAKWVTLRPGSGKITRVGFVFDTTTTPISKGTVGTGNTVSGFTIAVTPEASFTGGQIANIAQIFGQSQAGTVAPGTSTQIVYDESGDQSSNNNLGGANPDPTTGGTSSATGGISDGKANPTADGTDPGTGNDPTNTGTTNTGNDTGTGAGTKPQGGEDTVYTIAATPLNGPDTKPGASGPTSTNDDFTNKSIVVPAGKPPSVALTDAETPAVTFKNTVQNTSGSTQDISLLPTPPTAPDTLLDGTKVTIKDPVSGQTAVYTYTGGAFTFNPTGSTGGTSATKPVTITVPAGGSVNYEVTVDLPGADQLKAFSVPITAFADVNKDGQPTGEPSNTTIDRVYTNYLKLVKEARLLEADGTTAVTGPAGSFTTDQTALAAAATPGRIIEYRITYTNISSGGGTNSAILPAKNLVIKEDGSTAPNTWFGLTSDPKYPAQPTGSAQSTGGTITVTPNNGDIQVYTDTVTGDVAPAGTGTFTFQRKIK